LIERKTDLSVNRGERVDGRSPTSAHGRLVGGAATRREVRVPVFGIKTGIRREQGLWGRGPEAYAPEGIERTWSKEMIVPATRGK